MLSRQILTVLLVAELFLLAFAMGSMASEGASLTTDVLLAVFFVVSTFMFYALSVQESLQIEMTNFLVGYVAAIVFAAGGMLSGANMAVTVLGSLTAVMLTVNMIAVQMSKPRGEEMLEPIMPFAEVTQSTIPLETTYKKKEEKEEDYFRSTIPTTAVVTKKEEPIAPITQMMFDSFKEGEDKPITNNIVNVKIDAPKTTTGPDVEKLFLRDLQMKDSLEKIDDKISESDVKVDERIQNVKAQIEESFEDVKKEIDNLKEKQRMFITSKGGKKVHTPSCMVAVRIPEKKRIVLHDYEDAVKKGYTSCGVCLPNE